MAGGASRKEQLRRAKRAQRARELARGLKLVQMTLPAGTAERLQVAARDRDFQKSFASLLDTWAIRIRDFPALAELCWNIHVELLPARDAFGIYERNWRFVDPRKLSERERELIRVLADRFGGGIIHA